MRMNSTFKASCYAIALALFLLSNFQTSAQGACGVIAQNFATSSAGFSGNVSYANGSLFTSINKNANTTMTVVSPIFSNLQPNGSTVVGFQLGGYVKNTTYQINVYNSSNVLLATTTPAAVNTQPNANSAPYICQTITAPGLANGIGLKYEIIVTIPEPNGNGNNELSITFDDFSLGNIEAIILPVNFRNISATKAAKGVQVKWDVFEEIDVKEYQVEKSLTGTSFTKVGTVAANGSPSYNLEDAAPSTGVNIYRIKSIDNDGKFKYSTFARINLSTLLSLKAFPLPATNVVTIEHGIAARGTLTLSTIEGKALKAQTVAEGTSQTTLDLSGLQKGMYLVRFVKETGAIETLKIIKQ